jgi:hypothetical protein
MAGGFIVLMPIAKNVFEGGEGNRRGTSVSLYSCIGAAEG